ncbi:phosphoenolpyruvate--protein phosphotransferase [Oceanimonas baumannii]|uniref:phosphoenolpyruvate--protein phosphotransferase n=1 Tax=Oceanimonas baumannii TaxID=129578 RepID=A0A235CL94_9GAMM|nr:phosphoenolpyruvate--protein phosphotransferase [Oceanimonas baumannii]OYD25361.1 phosphoenolpyruvate--protein phosphotransferase [Oceanimonas baumannii]TDW62481.1 phosphocarrier protein FPr [Oceanimonas baumannii]
MFPMTTQDIKMNQTLASKQAAIVALSRWLEQDGYVKAGYEAGMLEREAQAATYLGQGIAIPHGTRECRHLVQKTGIKALHVPEGIDWDDGEKAYLILGIAASSGEHLALLRQLARVLSRDDLAETVRKAQHGEDIFNLLHEYPVSPLLAWHSDAIYIQQPAATMDELLHAAARRLQASAQELEQLQNNILHLGQGWWLSESVTTDIPRAAVLTTTGFEYRGQPVRALLALKARGRDHKKLLVQLADWLVTGKAAELTTLNNAQALQQALSRGPRPSGEPTSNQCLVTVRNHQGLHARPGALLVQAAKAFDADILVRNLDGDGHDVNAKSLMKLISLGVRPGHRLLFTATGPDSGAALARLQAVINEGLGELVAPLVPIAAASHPEPVGLLKGASASPGIAIGPLYVEAPVHFDYADVACDAVAEQRRFEQALQLADCHLADAAARAQGQAQEILGMHRELLKDPGLTENVLQRVRQGVSAPAAWWAAIDSAATRQASSDNSTLAERAADIRDIGRQVMAILCNTALPDTPEAPYIWVAEDIGPSDIVNMDTAKVLGLVTAGGGVSSHSAILARALDIPALVAMGGKVMALKTGTCAILNGDTGTLHVDPGEAVLSRALEVQLRERELAWQAWEQRMQPAITTDGYRLEVGANLGDAGQAAEAMAGGAEGVGLLRTEFAFMGHSQLPAIQQQIEEYQHVFSALGGRPLVARTLDAGGDKPLSYWLRPKEDNPFLGVRGIRLCMQQPELLETQLRALLAAAGDQPLRIMFPMVADWSEWRFGKEMFDRIQADIQAPDVQLGMMVEVPSAALNARQFAREADFFSIGTNDLTQYTLAADRGNGELAALSDGLHPAVLRLIAMTVEAAHAEGKWVGVCGELGADPQALPVLLGLGIDEVSVSPKRIPLVKARVRELSLAKCKQLAGRALEASCAGAVRILAGEKQ